MIPRGIFHAAPGAENSLLNILPDPGKINPAAQRDVDGTQRMSESDFSKSLKREVERRERPARREHDHKPVRPENRRPDRTEESSHGTRNEKSDAVLDRNAQGKPVSRTEDAKSEAVPGNPIDGEAIEDSTVQQREIQLFSLVTMLEEWIIRFLDQMNEMIGNLGPGPGDSKGLTGNELGPRFAIETQIPTQAGELKDTLAGLLLPADVKQSRDSAADSTRLPEILTGPKTPATDTSAKPGVDAFKDAIEVLKPVVQPKAQVFNPQIATVRENVEITSLKLAGKVIDPNRKDVFTKVKTDTAENNILKVKSQTQAILFSRVPKATLESRLDGETIDARLNPQSVSNFLARLTELVSKAGRGMLRQSTGAPVQEKIDLVLLPEPVQNQNPVQAIFNTTDNVQISRQPMRIEQPLVMEEIERVVQTVGKGNISIVRLRLHPPELGNLVIQFHRDENGLRIEFITPNSAVQKFLSEAAPKMIEKLADAGVDLDSLDVFLGNPGTGGEKSFSPLDDPSKPPVVVERNENDESVDADNPADGITGSIYSGISNFRVDLFA